MKKNKQIAIAAGATGLAVVNKPEPTEATVSLINSITSNNSFEAVAALVKSSSYLCPGGVVKFDAVLGNTTQISTLKRAHSPEEIATVIKIILDDLNEYFNVARKFTEQQLLALTIEIMEELWSCRLEELVAFCYALKKGSYIKIYERLDSSLFWEAWAKYEEDKQSYLHNRHLDLKGTSFKDVKVDDKEFKSLGTIAGSFFSLKEEAKVTSEMGKDISKNNSKN